MDREYINIMSEKCEEFLKDHWGYDELVEKLKDPGKFIVNEVNPWVKEMRRKGTNHPMIYRDPHRRSPIYFILSIEKS